MDHVLEISDLAPGRSVEAPRIVGFRIDDRFRPGHQIGDEVPGAGSDAKAVSRKSGSQEETRNGIDLADGGHAVRRAVDVAGPGRADLRLAQCRQQFERAGMGQADGRLDPGPDRGCASAPSASAGRAASARAFRGPSACPAARQARGFATASGTWAGTATRSAAAAASTSTRAASAYGERVATVAATRGRDPCRVQRIRQALRAGRDGQDGGADRRLGKAETELMAKRGGPGAAGQHRQPWSGSFRFP